MVLNVHCFVFWGVSLKFLTNQLVWCWNRTNK